MVLLCCWVLVSCGLCDLRLACDWLVDCDGTVGCLVVVLALVLQEPMFAEVACLVVAFTSFRWGRLVGV